jgi:Flp pilus assembly protein TadD
MLACAAVAAAVFAAYANHFHNSFHFDDWHTVEQNLFIRDLRNLPRFFTDARTFSALPSNQSYRPVVTATLAVDHWLGQSLDPFWFHVDNFLFFIAQCALMVVLFRRAVGPYPALFGAGLYALHAAIAETVNYVISRSDILSTLGVVACLAVYAQFPRARRFGLYLVPAVLGVLAKEQGAMAAPLLFLWLWLIERETPGRALRASLPAFIVCGAAVGLTLLMSPAWVAGGTSRLHYLSTQPFVMLRYFSIFIVPWGLSADSDWKAVDTIFDWRVAAGLAFVAATLFAAWRAARREETRPIAFGLLWFFVALLPTSSVVPLAEVTNDHRMYFPFVGLALAAACGADLLLRRRDVRVAVPACALLLAGHAVAAHGRNEVWRSEETLWRDVTEKSPGNARGWMNYGLTKMSKGEYVEADRCFSRGLEIAPQYGYLHVNMGILKGARGQPRQAEQHFKDALLLMPDVPVFRFYYARWLEQQGRDTEALQHLQTAIAMAPADPSPRRLMMKILVARNDWSNLAAAARDALRVRSDDPEARRYLRLAGRRSSDAPGDADAHLARSVTLYQQGRFAESLAAADEAAAVNQRSAEAHNNRCAALNALRRFAEAERACAEALRLKPDFELARNNLRVSMQGTRR